MSIEVIGDMLRCCTACGAVYRRDYERCANDGLALIITEDDPLIGTEVGPYVVEDVLGEGAMGRVYRAHHRHLVHKQFALKVLLGDVAMTQSMRLRFTKEAESASRLVHPNIVGVVDFGRSDKGLMYLAMELVEGVSLGDLLYKRPMEPARVIRLARQLALGLEHAHAMGIIHRDFKPDNILVVGQGDAEVARIADFGLAITVDEGDARLTETGYVMGTAGYIAPEQCTGKPIDHRADLYALGASLYEMLTGGILPFGGLAPEVIGAKTTRPAPPFEERLPGLVVPPDLAAVVLRLLERRPDQRYADASQVIDALDAIAPFEAPVAVPPRVRIDDTVVAVPTAAMRHGRRPWGRVVLGVAAAVAVAAAAVWWFAGRSEPSAAPVVAVNEDVAPAPVRANEPAPEPVMVPLAHEVERADSVVVVTPYDRVKPKPRKGRAPEVVAAVKKADAPIAPAAPVPPPPISSLPTPETNPPAPERPAPVERHPARIAGFAVDGSLPAVVVRKALDRVAPAVQACSSTGVETIEIMFSIGESRRASSPRAQRGSPAAGCVVAALSGVRTDAAPDVGDASVRVRVEFAELR